MKTLNYTQPNDSGPGGSGKNDNMETGQGGVTSQITIMGILRFETASLLGRTLFRGGPPIVGAGPQMLNLGCGTNRYDGFVNADFYAFRSGLFQKGLWMIDLRYKLKAPSNYWSGVYTEHTLEHLYPLQVLNLLKEVHRTLKPKAWVRVIVPDVSKYVQYYNGVDSHPLFERWPYRAEALRNIAQNHFHYSLWDAALMMEYLKRAGFLNVYERQFGKGEDHRLIKDSGNRQWESLYVEAQK